MVPAICERVPSVRVPTFLAIYRERCRLRIHRDYTLFTQPTFIPVERPLIPPHSSADSPALRTPSWRRDLDFGIKIKIRRFDSEVSSTILADFGFRVHIQSNIIPINPPAHPKPLVRLKAKVGVFGMLVSIDACVSPNTHPESYREFANYYEPQKPEVIYVPEQ